MEQLEDSTSIQIKQEIRETSRELKVPKPWYLVNKKIHKKLDDVYSSSLHASVTIIINEVITGNQGKIALLPTWLLLFRCSNPRTAPNCLEEEVGCHADTEGDSTNASWHNDVFHGAYFKRGETWRTCRIHWEFIRKSSKSQLHRLDQNENSTKTIYTCTTSVTGEGFSCFYDVWS